MKLSTRRIVIALIVLMIIIFSALYYQNLYLPHTKFKTGGSAIKIMAPIVNTESALPPEIGREGEEGGEAPAPDTDKDELSDRDEARQGTDPYQADTDGDGFSDGQEVKNGYNPKGEGRL